MATLNEIERNLRLIIRAGELADDEDISSQQVKFMVDNTRSFLIKRDVDKNKYVDEATVQDLKCVPVELVDKAECCDITTDCYVLRTKKKIPTVIHGNFNSMLNYVGSIDGLTQFQGSTYESVRWSQYEKYTSKLSRYYEKEGYLYVINNDLLDFIRIRGVFENPREIGKFADCAGEPCYSDDMPYPVSTSMISVINELVLTKELSVEGTSISDERNDARNIGNQQGVGRQS
tara:strand:+ start:544 stop:1239 length:696 start_codon:yes stop_codon:yes gene_type:complete